MDTHQPSFQDPSSLRHQQLLEWLQEKAVELQSREHRQDSEYLNPLMTELGKCKFECLQANEEIRNLFSNVSRRVEICEQQAESRRQKERIRRKMRESFGFGDLDDEELGFEESDEEPQEVPEYLKDFGFSGDYVESNGQGREEGGWGRQVGQIVIETDAIQHQKQFGQVDAVDLADLGQNGQRIVMIERLVFRVLLYGYWPLGLYNANSLF